jgi:hypothetical protein
MIKTEQGVLRQSNPVSLLMHILLLVFFSLTHPATATTSADTLLHDESEHKDHIIIIHSPDNTLHASITQELSEKLKLKRPDILVSIVSTEENINKVDNNSGLIIGIGRAAIHSADKHYPKTKKLYITTDPNKYRLDTNKNNNDAILYMAQSYCRQMQFIKLLNKHWRSISILNSREKPIDIASVQQCANIHDFKIHVVNVAAADNLTNKIKNALSSSDVLLALPDSSIYNSKTAKNILLTSYRYRKPVIAFSRQFANAGALASIHSNVEQIAGSASLLIEQYLAQNKEFNRLVNYPQYFNVSINRQVFRALELPIPDIDKLKQTLEKIEPGKSGNLQ